MVVAATDDAIEDTEVGVGGVTVHAATVNQKQQNIAILAILAMSGPILAPLTFAHKRCGIQPNVAQAAYQASGSDCAPGWGSGPLQGRPA
jgi:hypothetical protein